MNNQIIHFVFNEDIACDTLGSFNTSISNIGIPVWPVPYDIPAFQTCLKALGEGGYKISIWIHIQANDQTPKKIELDRLKGIEFLSKSFFKSFGIELCKKIRFITRLPIPVKERFKSITLDENTISVPVFVDTEVDKECLKEGWLINVCDLKIREVETDLSSPSNLKVEIVPFNDFMTQSAVKTIGYNNLQSIISSCIKGQPILSINKVSVEAITPGYSGAFVLKVTFGSVIKLIKISHDKSAIVKEYENLNLYSAYLSSAIKIDYERINPNQLSSEGWYSIIYEFVSYSTTLFGFIAKNQSSYSDIEKLLATVFSNERFLKLYQNRKEFIIPINKNILDDIDSIKASFIGNEVKILEPILKEYSTYFDKKLIKAIIEHHSFGSISTAQIETPNSYKILSHGDLHADNILVDSEKLPIIIDPGSINYKYWGYDINRLLIDLFLRGIGHQNIEYFDINSIKKDYLIFKKILFRQPIKIEKLKKDEGFITAINWILKNISKIHKTDFVEWQYRLGLGLELLKASYKNISLPANKRAFALLCACEAIRKANSNLESTKS